MIAKDEPYILAMNATEKPPHVIILQMQAKIPNMPKLVFLPNRRVDRINHRGIHLIHLSEWPLAEIKDIPMIKMCIRSEKDHSLIPCLAL
jgi:hypothetical protein